MSKDKKIKKESTEKKVKKFWKRKGVKTLCSAIIGIGLALVVGSITYSSYLILTGTTGTVPKVMLVPQVLFAGGLMFTAFVKAFLNAIK